MTTTAPAAQVPSEKFWMVSAVRCSDRYMSLADAKAKANRSVGKKTELTSASDLLYILEVVGKMETPMPEAVYTPL